MSLSSIYYLQNIVDNPSGALIKAVLLNGAQFLQGVDNGADGVTEIKPYDNNQGFGRMSLQGELLTKIVQWRRMKCCIHTIFRSLLYYLLTPPNTCCPHHSLRCGIFAREDQCTAYCL